MLTRDRLGTFIAVLFGTAVVTLSLGLLASASPHRPGRYAALTVAVGNPAPSTPADPFPESRPWASGEAAALAKRLAAVAGVTSAIPDREFYAQPVLAERPVGTLQEGHGWASAAMAPDRLVAGRAPAGPRDVVVGRDLGVPVGGTVTILTGSGPSSWTVAGLIAAPRLYVADSTAAELSPGVRVIGLTGYPDLSRIRATAAGATVLHGASLGDLEPRADARTRWIGLQVLTAMAALSTFAGVFVIASTSALSVGLHRRQIGLLRAVGATPAQVRRAVLGQAARTGAGAALCGVVLGFAAAPAVARVLVHAGFQPRSFSVGLHAWPALAGFVVGTAVAVLGALVAARRAARVGPLEALRGAEVEPKPMTRLRWIAGLVLGAGSAVAGVACALTDDLTTLGTDALLGAMLLVVCATVLAPAAVPPVVRLLLWPVRGALGMVMRESAVSGARRTASTAAPVLLTIAFAVFIAGSAQTSANAYADRRAETARAGTVLIPDGTPGLTDAAAPSATLPTPVYLDGTVVTGAGVDPATTTAAATLTGANAVVVSRSRAAQLRAGPGDTIEVTMADGVPTRLTITGLADDASAPAEVLLRRSTVRAHDPSALATAMPIAPGTVAPRSPGGRLVDVGTYARQVGADDDRLVWIFTLLLAGVSVGYGALAVANTLIMATTRRAPDYRLLRMAGATPRQVLISIAGESAVTVVLGAALGCGAAILALWGTTAGLRQQTSTSVAVSVPWATTAVAVAVCLVLAIAGSVVPARRRLTTAPS